jgi:hypothetical protein
MMAGAVLQPRKAILSIEIAPFRSCLGNVEQIARLGIRPFIYPVKNAVKYEFAARGNMPPVTV